MILVTGATGFIGRSLMPRLEQEGFSARAYQGRMNDPIQLRTELDGITTVIHLAGSEARGRDRLLHHVDVDGSERLVEEAHRAGVQRIIFASRFGADPASMHSLLQAKGQIERQIRRAPTHDARQGVHPILTGTGAACAGLASCPISISRSFCAASTTNCW